jgi:4-hydroxybenzoyl-CoA thioesterase
MPAFSMTRPLAFGDCDPSGIAYFPSYLHLMIGVLEAFFADIGHPWPAMVAARRIGTPTVTLNLTFERPGFHGDPLEFHLDIVAVGRSSLDLRHRVERRGEILWCAEQRIVATSLDTHRPVAWPDDIRTALSDRLVR